MNYLKSYSYLLIFIGLALILISCNTQSKVYVQPPDVSTIPPTLTLLAEGAIDQDDMCIWIHPTNGSLSTIITADKRAQKIFVYDLEGNNIQTISTPKPSNIDIRYGFPLGNEKIDIVAYLQRKQGDRVVVFKVDPLTRKLIRIDDNSIVSGEGNGGTLYHSHITGKFYFIKTTENKGEGGIEQFELFSNGSGQISGKKVRQWDLVGCEGAVADDEAGVLFIAQEAKGIWKVGAEPSDPTPGELIIRIPLIRIHPNNLVPDVEGLTIYKLSQKEGYLIASNQERNNFRIYERGKSHNYIGTFTVNQALHTDGIDIVNVDLGPLFPKGLFACHTDQKDSDLCPVLVTSWDSIATAMNLKTNTTWNPRNTI
jgi:3-phytase